MTAPAATRGVVWAHPRVGRGNPFSRLFAEALEADGWSTADLPTGLRPGPPWPDVVLVHWPEQALSARDRLRSRLKSTAYLATLRRARRGGARVVWVGHNALPHDAGPRQRRFLRRFVEQVDAVVHLSEAGRSALQAEHPALAGRPSIVVPHGDLAPAYGPLPDRAAARAVLGLPPAGPVIANIGRDRPYKGLDHLVQAVAALGDDGPWTVYSGSTSVPAGPRRTVLPGLVDEARLLEVVAAADLVVFPFDRILHSGSVILALGLGRPVLAPRLGALPELQAQVGEQWLHLHQPPLDATTLRDALRWADQPRPGRAEVAPSSWAEIARAVRPILEGTDA